MKISRLIINNFRVFGGRHEFDFSNKQLILVGGNNGHGKSSLFDAIQWCLTGEIKRYRGSSEYQNFNYLINEAKLAAGVAEASVEVSLKSDGGLVHTIKRCLQKGASLRTTLTINEKPYGVKEGTEKICKILFLSKDESAEVQKDQMKNLSTYFAATQLLSQDQLNEFILASNPQDRFALMEKVLGLDIYGGEFGKYLLGSLQVIKDEKTKVSTDRQEIREVWVEVSTKLKEKEDLQLKLGGATEEVILKDLIELALQIKESGISIPETLLRSTNVDKDFLLSYRVLRQSISKQEEKCERILLLLQDSRPLFDLTEEKYVAEQKDSNNKLEKIQTMFKRRESGIARAEHYKSDFYSLLNRRKTYVERQREVAEREDTIYQINQKISRILNNAEVLDLIEKYESIGAFLALYIKTEKDLFEIQIRINIDNLSNISNQIQERINMLTESSEQLVSLKERTIKDKESVNDKLIQLTNELELNKNNSINQMINDVQLFLLEQSKDDLCPVCGTSFQSIDKLHDAVRFSWDEANRQLSIFEQEVMHLTSRKNELDRELSRLNTEFEKINNQKLELKKSYDENQVIIEQQRVLLGLWVVELNSEDLNQLKELNDNFLRRHSAIYNVILPLEDLRAELERVSSERDVVLKWLEEQLKLLGRRGHYLLGSEEAIVLKIQKYDQYLLQSGMQMERLTQESEKASRELISLNHQWRVQGAKINEIKELIPEFDGLNPKFEIWIESYYQQKSNWNRIATTVEQLLGKGEAFINKGDLAKIKREEENLRKEIDEKDTEINHYEKLEKEIDILRERHNKIRSSLMTDYLLNYSEAIDQLFMQISPHAIYKHVHLVPREGKLFVLMSEQREEAVRWTELSEKQLAEKFNASLTFSSAQANVLAVCIFLSLALSQRWTTLEMIGIDDPFQNMDDINVFSFIDVISQIIPHKQVIISSHNEDFVNLIKNKSGLEQEKIGYVHIKSYSRDRIELETNCISNAQ